MAVTFLDKEDTKVAKPSRITFLDEQPQTTMSSTPTQPSALDRIGEFTRQTEQEIGERPSAISKIRENPLEALLRASRSPIHSALETIPPVIEGIEGAISSAGLAFQRGEPKDIIGDVSSAVSGKRPSQLGDLLRTLGLGEGPQLGPIELSPAAIVGTVAFAGIGGRSGAKGIGQAGTATGRAIGQPIKESTFLTKEFFTGNLKRIRNQQQLINTTADDFVLGLRRGGKNHGKLLKSLADEGDAAWQPMDDLAKSINELIPFERLQQRVASKAQVIGEESARQINETIGMLKSKFPGQQAIPANKLIEEMTNLGRGIRKSVKTGKGSSNAGERLIGETRSIIADELDDLAPAELKGSITQAHQNWQDYRAVTDQIHSNFSPKASPQASTATGVNFLNRAGQGKLKPSELKVLDNVQQRLGTDVTSGLTKQADKLAELKFRGSLGKRISTIVQFYVGFQLLRKIGGDQLTQMLDLAL